MNGHRLDIVTKKIINVLLAVSFCISLVSCKGNLSTKSTNVSNKATTFKHATKGEGIVEPSLFDEVIFGKYEQDGNLDNGREDVVWEIIDFDDETLLLISKYVIDAVPYDENIEIDDKIEPCTWESSYIREYLNDSLYNTMFDNEEKESIVLCNVSNGKEYGVNNSDIPLSAGVDTEDKVYILSKDEIRKYLGFEFNGSADNYMTKQTPFSKTRINNYIDGNENFAIWHKERKYDKTYEDYAEYWVRARGEVTEVTDYEFTAIIVTKDGHLGNRAYPYCVCKATGGDDEYDKRYYKRGVRPVIRVRRFNIKKDIIDNSISEHNADEVVASSDGFDTLMFGRYEQDNNYANGAEPIEWIILDKTEDKMLVVSKYILDYVEYNNVYDKRATWFDSSLRAYANNEFYNNSFNEREKIYILPIKYKTYDNPVYNSIEEKETIDKIAILGFDECMKYFDIGYYECIKNRKYDNIRLKSNKLGTEPTIYAREKFHTDKNIYEEASEDDFWLRNEGRSGEEKTYKYNSAMSVRETVDFKGSIYDLYIMDGGNVSKRNLKLGFRPMMWIDSQISLLP